MNKPKYINHNKENYKKFIIVLFVMIFIMIGITLWLESLKVEEIPEIVYEDISSIEEVILYHKSKYISEEKSTESGYNLDVYVSFSKPLNTENDESNEEYFTKLIEDCAKVIVYKPFKLIDNEHNIIIKVICSKGQIEKIYINDMEDYYIYMDSQLSLKKYKEIETTSFSVQSEVLQRCIDSGWSADTYLGEKDSIFEDYYIFFDEGLKARIIDGKIYNLIFTKNYTGNVVENLFPGIDLENVTSRLGKATFSNEDESVIGYKGENVYVFFNKDEISVYRNTEVNSDDFFELADDFLQEKIDLLDFMNELTYIWPDYSKYEYNSTSVWITYPLKGIEITINSGDINGILVYNNNKSSLSKIGRYLEDTNFVGRLQLDLVFEAEKRRVEDEKKWGVLTDEFWASLDNEKKKIIGESLNYEIYPVIDDNGAIRQMNFVSKFGQQPNRQINDNIASYMWITNDYFLYSKANVGIFFYNLNTGRVQRIYTGAEPFEFKEYEDGLLKYDDNGEIILQF